MDKTADLLMQAKNNLLAALREAETTCSRRIVKRLETLCGNIELLQHLLSEEIVKARNK